MPYDGSVTFEQAEKAKERRLSIGSQRRVPDMLGMIEDVKNSKTYHVFNVGPWSHVVNTGSTGQFFIPACPTEKPYIEMLRSIPAIMDELVVKNEKEMDRLMDDGWKFAQEIVGDTSRGRVPTDSLRHFGVFPGANAEPTPQDLYEAKKMLEARCTEIVREIRNIYATNRETFSKVMRPEVHIKAAQVLNLNDEPWLLNQTPEARAKCEFCGAMNDAVAVKCQNCSEIINPEKYKELKAKQAEILAAEPKRGPGRPPMSREQ
jgi:hypothetical protein